MSHDVDRVVTYNRHTAILERNNTYAAYTDNVYVINYQPKQILLNETYQTNNDLIDKDH